MLRILSTSAIKEEEESFLDDWPHKTEIILVQTMLANAAYTHYTTTTSFEVHEHISV